MYLNSAYLHNSLIDFKDKSRPLIVGSCGTYRLHTHPKLPTYRPRGRLDFQIIYVSAGTAHFHFGSAQNDTVVSAGNMVIYRPKEFQKYEYYATDQTEVYITDDMRVVYAGTSLEYVRIFKKMISELQRRQADYEEMLSMLLRHLFILLHRQLSKQRVLKNEYLDSEMDLAAQYFNDNYNSDISIQNYAASRGMSVSWFIRNFKDYTGSTPMQYIVSVRITNAQMLLETTKYTVTEIGRIVGYENPLYFSRVFRRQKGFSPSAYRKTVSKS